MSDRVAVSCSHCGAQYALPSQYLGKAATCKKCGQKFVAQPAKKAATAELRDRTHVGTPLMATPSAILGGGTGLPPRSEIHPASLKPAAPALSAGATLDDSVVAWLSSDEPEEETVLKPVPEKPRVLTTGQMCEPSQRADVRRPSLTANKGDKSGDEH